MNYWLDLFTGTTWDEFRNYGARVTGFRSHLRKYMQDIRPGDIFLCYLTGVMRWVGALEIVGKSDDKAKIWKDDEYPVRFAVKPLVLLDAEHGVPMEDLEGRVDFYASAKDAGKFKGFVRRSPNLFKNPADGQLVLDLLRAAERDPQSRKVDKAKLYPKRLYSASRKKGKKTVPASVSVPDADEPVSTGENKSGAVTEVAPTTRHTEVQFTLLKLGADMGISVWVARNDRSKTWNGKTLSDMPGIVDELPAQFNDATHKTIELIDVLWLHRNSFMAAFEIECTTSVYSGLLRMSDLLALQPDLKTKLYLVAPDDRRSKVEQEILRPTFTLRERPLNETCGFLAFSKLLEHVEAIQRLGLAASLKPDFLDKAAEYFNDSSGMS